MMRFLLILFTITHFIIFSIGCKKSADIPSDSGKRVSDLNVPENFSWKTSREVAFEVDIRDQRYLSATYVIGIYTADGRLLSKGAAQNGGTFKTTVSLANTINEIIIIKTNPDNSNDYKKVTIKDLKVAVTLPENQKSSVASVSSDRPDCSIGCTRTVEITENNQSVHIAEDETVCVRGSNKTFRADFSFRRGGVLRICGTNLTLNSLGWAITDKVKELIITPGSTVHLDGISFGHEGNRFTKFTNYGDITVKGGALLNYHNYGNIVYQGDFQVEGIVTNDGSITVNGNVSGGTLLNNGSVTSTGNFSVGNLINNCKLIVGGNSHLGFNSTNSGYIQVKKETRVSSLTMNTNAMLYTRDLILEAPITGLGGPSLVKVTGVTQSNSDFAVISGPINICDMNGLEQLRTDKLLNGAKSSCDINIPLTGCNSEGNGTFQFSDRDGDRISDNLDDFPDDGGKAFINTYPAGLNTENTLLFEDMWPYKGDFDMNDVVIGFSYKIITNSLNKVVECEGNYRLRARGGIFSNGFGVEFPMLASTVVSCEGGIVEQGQKNAVVLVFEDMHKELPQMNTRLSDPYVQPKSFKVRLRLENGPDLYNFGLSEYNPFIYNYRLGGRSEVHMIGKKPTSLVNEGLLGTGDDYTNLKWHVFYISKDALPFAIMLPVNDFKYPLEGKDIGLTYMKLKYWVQMSQTFSDWYKDYPGYINKENLYPY
ncbi:LruC domain-containing protein [Desertivirga arenae]|uniref:LruC domain-containing protein n=1 Tax=Desertivirga arenae TaxID=2810309 RepID=UPI001A9787E6|nr:LruC domain-containing protein [Pedobacter sp. SYSU D00823]